MPVRKRLVVCCDGTWDSFDSVQDFTNVSRIASAVSPHDTRVEPAVTQVTHYEAGSGAESDAVQHTTTGTVGLGLSRYVRNAYGFIVRNYCDGDEILLFGFSRGAYVARSVAGLIGYAGLINRRDMDDFALLWEGYRRMNRTGQKDVRAYFPDRRVSVQVRCVGVWETVGALGIPGHLNRAFTQFYQFHDTKLGAHVEHAFQALALDEKRIDFEPAVWAQMPDGRDNGQVLRQVWFPGVHANVGGGYGDHGLSDIALAWMAGQVEPLVALDVDALRLGQDRRDGWGLGRIHNPAHVWWQVLGTEARRPFADERGATFEAIHSSVAARLAATARRDEAAYESLGLSGIDVAARITACAPIEEQLRWSDKDLAAPTFPQRPLPSVLGGRLLSELECG